MVNRQSWLLMVFYWWQLYHLWRIVLWRDHVMHWHSGGDKRSFVSCWDILNVITPVKRLEFKSQRMPVQFECRRRSFLSSIWQGNLKIFQGYCRYLINVILGFIPTYLLIQSATDVFSLLQNWDRLEISALVPISQSLTIISMLIVFNNMQNRVNRHRVIISSFDVDMRLINGVFRKISAQSQKLRATTHFTKLLDLRVRYWHRPSIFLPIPDSLDELWLHLKLFGL